MTICWKMMSAFRRPQQWSAAAIVCVALLLSLTCHRIQSFSQSSFSPRYPLPGVLQCQTIVAFYRGRALFPGGRSFVRSLSQKNNNDDDDEDEDDKQKIVDGDEDDFDADDEENEDDLYTRFASSEFTDNDSKPSSSSSELTKAIGKTSIDWGGAYGKLRERVGDIQSGQKTSPSKALFRIMSSDSPNEAIGKFVNMANPEVVAAMSGAVNSLLGGLSNPSVGVETIVKASGEKLGNLCFQLQMTGYMFRNAEYVVALKDLMNIEGTASPSDYEDAFNRIDSDGSGYIDAAEVKDLLSDVYEGKAPMYEADAFLKFFNANDSGRISWEEFEKGLGAMSAKKAADNLRKTMRGKSQALPQMAADMDESDDDDDDDEFDSTFGEPNISGMIEVELKNGKIIELEAKEYIKELKKEAAELQKALQNEKRMGAGQRGMMTGPMHMDSAPPTKKKQSGGIAGYISSLQGDVQSLTKGISPDVLETMKLLIAFVLDGGPSGKGKKRKDDKNLLMEIPGSALQQLALWQLVLGYRLREAEATGEYRKLLE